MHRSHDNLPGGDFIDNIWIERLAVLEPGNRLEMFLALLT